MSSPDDSAAIVGKFPCEKCGSADNVVVRADGHGFCHGCQAYYKDYLGTGDTTAPTAPKKDKPKDLLRVEPKAFGARGITLETVTKFGCGVSELKDGTAVQVYTYYRNGMPVAQKAKTRDKKFTVIGDGRKLPLFGAHLWGQGKMLVVTEGELDCLTVSQIQGNKWPTVSLPNGAASAAKSFKDNLDYFEGFEKVVIMFDMDDVGQQAALEAAEVLPPGKAYIASLPLKDPNECLLNGKREAVHQAIWTAKQYRPDGISSGVEELWDIVDSPTPPADAHYPYPELNTRTSGIRKGEVVTILAGSGVGKSTFCKEVAYALRKQGKKVGLMFLEESAKKTLISLIGIDLNKPLRQDESLVTKDEIRQSFERLIGHDGDGIHILRHFGSMDIDNLIRRMRFMAVGLGCDYIVLDHLSIVVSGLLTGDERKMIDVVVTRIRTLVEETGVGVFLVSHLRRPEGDEGYEDGKRVTLNAARGSHSIVQISDIIFAINKDGPLEVLKNRFTGEVGEADFLSYSNHTGRLLPSESKPTKATTFDDVKDEPDDELPF